MSPGRCAIGRTRIAAAAVALAALAPLAGCGSACRDIAARRLALGERVGRGGGPDGRLHVPMVRANQILAATLAAEPVEVEIGPDLLPSGLPLPLPTLVARVQEVRVVPARPGRVGLAIQIEIRDAERELVTLALATEVTPHVVRAGGTTRLEIGLGADSLVAVKPTLGPDATGRLTDALARWLPDDLRRRVPRFALERGARELARHLTGAAYRGLRATLLARLGEVTRLRIRLPDLPIASVSVRSPAGPIQALEIDLMTDLPVRGGPVGARSIGAGDQIQLRLSGGAVAAIANWAIDSGRLPRYYTRNLKPRPDGQYRPVLEWVGRRARRPLVIHIFQESGGCSSFAVGVRPEVSIAGGQLVATLRDREIERVRGSAVLEIAVWLRSLVSSAADVTRRIAATTQLEAGGRRFDTRITGASLAGDDLVLELAVSPSAQRGCATCSADPVGATSAPASALPASTSPPSSSPQASGALARAASTRPRNICRKNTRMLSPCLDKGSVVSSRPTEPAVRWGADEVGGVPRRNRPAERECAKP
jgi:hypothetical protein